MMKILFITFKTVPFLRNISDPSMTDKELVILYKESGDVNVLGQLYQRYMDLVYGVCLKYLKEPETSRDAVMQIFEELVSKLKKYEVDNFRGWLHQLTKNHCLMQLRAGKNKKIVELKTDLMQTEENLHLNGVLEKEENFKKLQYCLGELTDEQRTAIRLFYLDGKCYNEIVEATGHEWNQVRSFIQNGRRNLKICMDKQEVRGRKSEVGSRRPEEQ